jgi:predicted Zn-dependent protease
VYEEAETLLRSILREQPADAALLNRLALVLIARDRAAEAAAALEKALRPLVRKRRN